MTLYLGLPGHRSNHHGANEQRQQELQEARRMLKERIRNDWEYPTLPAHRSCGRRKQERSQTTDDDMSIEDRVAGFRFHTPGMHYLEGNEAEGVQGSGLEAVEWREREYSSGNDDDDDDDEGGEKQEQRDRVSPTSASSATTNGSTYKFEAPDSVGTQLRDWRVAKKRKRHRAMEEEMRWNDGLEHWVRRRDAWCGARTAGSATQPPLKQQQRQDQSEDIVHDSHGARPEISSTLTSASASSSPRPSTSSSTAAQQHEQPPVIGAMTLSTPASSLATTPDLAVDDDNDSENDSDDGSGSSSEDHHQHDSPTQPSWSPPDLDVLLPVAPPLLPSTHPVRRKIGPSMYPEIYSKIILQSRTPSVPINLRALVQALVQGWKDDGEWPPKSSSGAPQPAETNVGRKKFTGGRGGSGGGVGHASGIREGVKRVLRLTGVGEKGHS